MRTRKVSRSEGNLLRTMGNCFEMRKTPSRSSSCSSNEGTEAVVLKSNCVVNYYKPRILCLHGWRTNGEILSMQMAALQANTSMNCVFIDAPFPGRGDPDRGIALFYPDRPYYEWFYRSKKVVTASEDTETLNSKYPKASAKYENLDESIKFLINHLETHGPYDGILGFSQGASMVTRLAKIQEEFSQLDLSAKRKFEFVILVGGVPPQELADNIPSSEGLLRIPSLHIMGEIDPLLPDSLILESLYSAVPERVTLTHAEGHNIPSIRTNIYPQIQKFLDSTAK